MRVDSPQWLFPTMGGGCILAVSQPDVDTVAGMIPGRALITDEKWGT